MTWISSTYLRPTYLTFCYLKLHNWFLPINNPYFPESENSPMLMKIYHLTAVDTRRCCEVISSGKYYSRFTTCISLYKPKQRIHNVDQVVVIIILTCDASGSRGALNLRHNPCPHQAELQKYTGDGHWQSIAKPITVSCYSRASCERGDFQTCKVPVSYVSCLLWHI